MLRKPDSDGRTVMATERIVPLDRARTFITLLVVLHHSVVNYTYFGNGDRMRWLGFDLVVLFNDSFFMACMFFISGLFVRDSLARRGTGNFLGNRAWRLGVPFLISIFMIFAPKGRPEARTAPPLLGAASLQQRERGGSSSSYRR